MSSWLTLPCVGPRALQAHLYDEALQALGQHNDESYYRVDTGRILGISENPVTKSIGGDTNSCRDLLRLSHLRLVDEASRP